MRIEAQKQVVVNWTLAGQAWDFKDILATFEPFQGFLERRPDGKTQAVWKMRLVKDLEQGTVDLYQNQTESPFKVELLDEDRIKVVPTEAPPIVITPVPRKTGDSLMMVVILPDPPLLNDVKFVRVLPRTNVGF